MGSHGLRQEDREQKTAEFARRDSYYAVPRKATRNTIVREKVRPSIWMP
jgi:hypothetical protein